MASSTQYQYERTLARLDTALNGRSLDDAALADYLNRLFKAGKSQGTAQQVVAAVRYRARISGDNDPVGPNSKWVLAENRYENLSPLAEARTADGVRLHAELLGEPVPKGSDREVVEESGQQHRWKERLKSGRGRMPDGRRFMGELYRRDLDYPKTLMKGPRFRMCRACGKPDQRMSGIYWCFACALMIRRARRRIRGTTGLLTSIFGGGSLKGDFEWKSLMDTVRLIRADRGVPRI